MDPLTARRRPAQNLYPPIDPFDQRMLDVGDGHRIYTEQCGLRDGVPVVVLHGGPGGGCSPVMRRYFDPGTYRVVLFDQRGCGRSRPHASVEANTTWHLVADIERIRVSLGIERWIVFGGSWGATLALAYAQAHPERVARLLLRGVFLATRRELDWFYRGGAGQFWPDLWARFLSPLAPADRADPIAGYARHLFSGNLMEETRFGRSWAAWENALASMASDGAAGESPGEYARAFARLENHYFRHAAFFEEDGQLLSRAGRMRGIPGTVVQGRYDMICPPASAWALAQHWPCDLRIVPRAGHALSEAGITAALIEETDRLRRDADTMRLAG